MPRIARGLCSAFAFVAALAAPAAFAQVVVSVDRLDGSDPGTPVPPNLIVVDVFVDVATTDVWTAAGMRGVTSNSATLVYAGAGPTSLINPGLANRFVTCVSKPRLRNADARFNNAGAASAGRYDPTGPTAVASPTEVNATWFASPPETAGSPSFDGYIARVVLDLSATGVDPSTVVVVGSLSPPPGTVALFESRPVAASPPGTVAATFDVPTTVGISWGVYGRQGTAATGACCTPAGCLVTTRSACTAAGGSYAGDNVPCSSGMQYAPPVSCAFENISTSGTLAAGASACDDCGEPVPIGFPFTFFDSTRTSVNVCSNGYLTFGAVLNEFTNDPAFPDPTTPNDMIAPYWDDWNPFAGGDVYYATVGAFPNRRFIVQWNQVFHFATTTPATFEVILSETSNKIEFRYALTNASDTPTIGIENADGTVGVNVPVGTQGVCTTIAVASAHGPCNCPCDFNADGNVTSQDYFDFLTCFFRGCP